MSSVTTRVKIKLHNIFKLVRVVIFPVKSLVGFEGNECIYNAKIEGHHPPQTCFGVPLQFSIHDEYAM